MGIDVNTTGGKQQYSYEKYVFYLNIINQRLDKLFQIHKLNTTNIEDTISKLKPPIFWKDKPNIANQAKKWDKIKIKKMFDVTYDLEKKIKTNSLIEKDILIKKLLIDICSLANAQLINQKLIQIDQDLYTEQ